MTEMAIVDVTALGGLGDGIARLEDGRVVLVPDAVPGDRLLIEQLPQKSGMMRGKIAEILTRAGLHLGATRRRPDAQGEARRAASSGKRFAFA